MGVVARRGLQRAAAQGARGKAPDTHGVVVDMLPGGVGNVCLYVCVYIYIYIYIIVHTYV